MKKLPFANLRVRLALLFFLALLPVLAVTMFTYLSEEEKLVSHINLDVMRIARFAASVQERLIERTRQLLVALSEIPEVDINDGESCSKIFRKVLQENPHYTNIGAINPEGRSFCSAFRTVDLNNYKDQPWFQHSIGTRDFAMAPTNDEGSLNISYPAIGKTGKIKAVLYATIAMDELEELIYQIQLPAEAEFFIVSGKGRILVHVPQLREGQGRAFKEGSLVQAILAKGQGVSELPGLDGIVRLYAFVPLASAVDTGFYVGVGIPKSAAYREAKKVLLQHFVGLSISIMMALVLVWFGSELFILKQVKALVVAVGRLSEGDMTARSGLTYGGGELDGLARAFDEMAETLEKQALQLREAEVKYRTLVEQIPAITYAACLDELKTSFYISPQITGILEFSPEEWTADPHLWFKQIHPEDLESVRRALADCRASLSNREFRCEYRIFSKSGRQLWFADEAVKVQSEGLNGSYLQGTMRDVSEQQNAREKLLSYQKQLRSLASQLSLAEERERRRIATELHDHVGQALAMCRIKLGYLKELAPSDEFASMVDDVRGPVVQAIKETRSLIFKISSPILYELGFEAALEWLVEETQKNYDIQVSYQDDGNRKPLDDDIRALLFQAVGELLVNVVKHARAQGIILSTCKEGNNIVVRIEDDGVGFDVDEVSTRRGRTDGFGLFNIRERLAHMGGRLEVDSEKGRGTRITLVAPISNNKVG